jgi:Phage integrase, N-terminal SAM-like domain
MDGSLEDNGDPVGAVDRFLGFLSSAERSPNTVKSCAHDLKDWFCYLSGRGLAWDEVTLEDVASSPAPLSVRSWTWRHRSADVLAYLPWFSDCPAAASRNRARRPLSVRLRPGRATGAIGRRPGPRRATRGGPPRQRRPVAAYNLRAGMYSQPRSLPAGQDVDPLAGLSVDQVGRVDLADPDTVRSRSSCVRRVHCRYGHGE